MVATLICVCGEPGRSTMTSRGRVEAGSAELRRRRRAARPGAERRLRQLAQLGKRDRAGDDQRGVAGHEMPLPECLQLLAGDLLDAIRPSRAPGTPYGCARPYSAAPRHVAGDRPSDCPAAERDRRASPRGSVPLPPPESSDAAPHRRAGSAPRENFARGWRSTRSTHPSSTPADSVAPICATSSASCGAVRVAVP